MSRSTTPRLSKRNGDKPYATRGLSRDERSQNADFPFATSQLSSHDPISAQPLKATIGQKLAEAQQLNGGAEVFQQQWLSRVDPLLTEDLFARLDGRLAG